MKYIKKTGIITGILAAGLLLALFFQIQALGEVAKIKETEESVFEISEEEKKNLEILFLMNQKSDELKAEEKTLTERIHGLQDEKKVLEADISDISDSYERQKETLAKVLVAYERRGMASYLDAVLSSGDLRTFLRSVNILRDLSSGVNRLLEELKENEKKLRSEQLKLAAKIEELNREQEELKVKIQQQEEQSREQEAFLESLKEEKDHYEEQLKLLKDIWEGAKEYFKEGFSEDFTVRLQQGNITTEDLNLRINLLKISGELQEEKLNEALTPMAFHLTEGEAVLEVPDKSLVLNGTFEIQSDTSLLFQVTGGTFYELPLEESSVAELFSQGYPVIDFSYFMEDLQFDMKIGGISLGDGTLKFTLKPVFNLGH